MTNAEHNKVADWINKHKELLGVYPTHKQIIYAMLQYASEITYKDGIEYGLGSTFRSRISDIRKEHDIISYDKKVPTRFGTIATVKAHKLREQVA